MKNLTLKIIASDDGGCAGDNCPTVYQDSDGRIFVQGFKVNEEIGVILPENETIIEITPTLIDNLIKSRKG